MKKYILIGFNKNEQISINKKYIFKIYKLDISMFLKNRKIYKLYC